MFTYLLFLRGTNKDLALFEFDCLWKTYFSLKYEIILLQNKAYVLKTEQNITGSEQFLVRSSGIIFFSKVIYSGPSLDEFSIQFKQKVSEYEGKSFVVRIRKARKNQDLKQYSESELAKPIWNCFKQPKVDLEHPQLLFVFVFLENTNDFYVCEQLFENEKEYLERMPKFRPVKMPYTLKADLARSCINLLCLEKGLVLDPFAGIGGILLEAADMGFQVVSNDISWNDVKYMQQNFDYYFPNVTPLRILADSRTQFLKPETIDGIVTDIPYGRCSRKLGIDLYEQYLQSAQLYLKKGKRMIVIYANFVEFKSLALKYFTQVTEIEQYINKSMTRYILVLEKN